MKTLKASGSELSDSHFQLEVLSHRLEGQPEQAGFESKLRGAGLFPLTPQIPEIFQINIGKMCNQVCKHCHVDAGPDRREIMTKETMKSCLEVLRSMPSLKCVDITGGAPEMNPDFRWLVGQIRTMGRKIMVRCNLTIILANEKFHDLPSFYRDNQVELIGSLPFYSRDRTDRQRGEGVFEKSIEALKMLNLAGYGKEDSGLILNLVYNPAGAFLPAGQAALETEYRELLFRNFGIMFNRLFAITNVPIGRFLDFLLRSGNYETYMEKLTAAFNPEAARHVMCRNTISVGWDGTLYDCDFNQMLDLPVNCRSQNISQWDPLSLNSRKILTNAHCFACTAGSGSSCGGTLT